MKVKVTREQLRELVREIVTENIYSDPHMQMQMRLVKDFCRDVYLKATDRKTGASKLTPAETEVMHTVFRDPFDATTKEVKQVIAIGKKYGSTKKFPESFSVSEASTSADAGPFNTPNAFSGNDPRSDEKRKRIMAASSLKPVKEGVEYPKYTDIKKDETLTPRQKFGTAIREIRNNIREIENYLDANMKIKTENGVTSTDYWKRTHGHLTKIGEDMTRLMGKIRELRG
jgi:hypothetical protein